MKTLHSRINRSLAFLLLLGAGLMLASCGESNNLKNPGTSGPVTKCSELANTTCVTGRFIADAVANLNYECGTETAKITGVTDVDGSFACPVNTSVTFSLVNPDTTVDASKRHKIILGTTTVKMPAELGQTNGNIFVNTYLYITPTTLAAGNTTSANNITRLLQGIRIDDHRDITDAARRVVIDDLDKRMLKEPYLMADVVAADFAVTSTIQSKLNAWLTQIGKGFDSEPNANITLAKSLHSTVSGIYFIPGSVGSLITQSGVDSLCQDTGSYLLGLCGFSSDNVNYFLGATWEMVDRLGRIVGFGVYSEGPRLPPATVSQAEWDACKLLFRVGTPGATGSSLGCQGTTKKQPDRLPMMKQNPASTPYWSLWNDNGQWAYSYSLLDATGTAVAPARTLTMTGRMDRDAIAGSNASFGGIFHNESPAVGALGTLTEGANYLQGQTRFTMLRGRTIAPTLDPSYWCLSTDSDCAIPAVGFPINVAFKFYTFYKDAAGATECTGLTDPTCLVGTLHASILRDGNVITNLHGNCGAVNATTLVGSGSPLPDIPLGVVAQAYAIDSRSYASVMLLVPYRTDIPALAALKGIQMGTTTTSSAIFPARLRIDSAAGSSTKLHLYSEFVTSSTGYATTTADADNSVTWVNQYAIFQGDLTSYGVITAEPESTAICP